MTNGPGPADEFAALFGAQMNKNTLAAVIARNLAGVPDDPVEAGRPVPNDDFADVPYDEPHRERRRRAALEALGYRGARLDGLMDRMTGDTPRQIETSARELAELAGPPPARPVDPSQGRGNFGDTPTSPEHEFREMIDTVLGPRGMIKRGPIRAFEAGPEGLRRTH
ncbi:hypothetical protein GCM10023320_30940 [Pseudonocardia adelaidensis]|uniref:Uncharacterized protein n=1 Tax=Pseudonocardia adelaidensis TaxID=648754 RepID=A0ABP9NIG8_9PSEU